jgi:hypothetical protein
MREILRVDEPLDRLVQGNTRRDEDRQDDGETGELLASVRAQEEGDTERDGRQGITEVVDQVGEQSHRAAENEQRDLNAGCDSEDSETDRDSSYAFS